MCVHNMVIFMVKFKIPNLYNDFEYSTVKNVNSMKVNFANFYYKHFRIKKSTYSFLDNIIIFLKNPFFTTFFVQI